MATLGDVSSFEAAYTAFLNIPAVYGDERRRPSVPIITSEAFHTLADIAFCEDSCSAEDVSEWIRSNPQSRPVIYVNGNRVSKFLSEALPSLRSHSTRFVLVVHDSDQPMPDLAANKSALLDEPLLVAWFAQNAVVRHPRLHPIPIGFEVRYGRFGAHPEALIAGRRFSATTSPTRRVLASFNGATFGSLRGPLSLKAHELGFDVIEAEGVRAMSQEGWYSTVAEYSLVLCPRGNGLDTFRAWDTLYLGRIPVVASSPMDAVFDGLPVLILDSWHEISDIAALERREAEIVRGMATGAFDLRRLRFDYYGCLIVAAAGRMTPGAAAMGMTCPPSSGAA